MQEITILFWRDIPAQLLAGRGRKALKYKLPEKYEKAIDICAMKTGAKDSEMYLEGWRKLITTTSISNSKTLEVEAKKLMAIYDNKKLKYLINNEGWDKSLPPKINF